MKKLSFSTTHGNVLFNVFDGGYPGDVDCAIIMFDLSNEQSCLIYQMNNHLIMSLHITIV
jgi:hypothetical protein